MGVVVVVGISLETTIAAHVAISVSEVGAINELLLGERKKLTSGNEVGTLDGTSGGESPAGTALTLILDRGDGTSLNPVDGVGVALLEDLVLSGDALALDISEHVLVLSSVPVRELVVASLPGLLGGVDLLNEVVGEVEVLESSEEVLNIDVLSAELGNPLKVVISDWLHTEIKF